MGPIMIDLQGLLLSPEERELLLHPQVGGVIFFTRNYKNPSQIKQLISEIRQIRPELLLAVDQEGGRVQRFREDFAELPACGDFGFRFKTDPKLARKQARAFGFLMARELLDIGMDFSFAPVLDINRGMNQVIGDRSFGEDVETVCQLAAEFIEGMDCAGMARVAKHFPGHGHVTADSHLALPIDERDFDTIYQTDMQPFIKLMPHCTAMMPAHILYPAVDQHPVCFSSSWLQDILRTKLNYKGAIISDDMNMAGAQYGNSCLERVEKALQAGCDLILICNNRQNVIEVVSGLKYEISSESEARLKRLSRNSVDENVGNQHEIT
jgi:beta-N-acetylhexosaminidase